MPGWFSRQTEYAIPGVLLAIIIALLVLPPIWFLIQGSLYTTNADFTRGELTLEYYQRLIQEPKLFTSSMNSVVFAVGSSVVALLFGAMLAWVVERTNAAFKTLAYLTTIISLGTPFILYVSAWLFLLGRAGPINDLYRLITGSDGVLINVYSMSGMILIEGFLWSPLVFLLLSATFRTSNPEYEEAARICGASVWDTIRRITLKLAMPSVLALALLVFIRAIEAFEVPALVGLPGRIDVLTTDIYLDLSDVVPPDFGHASSFSVFLLVIVGIMLAFYNRLSKSADRYHTVTGKGYRARIFDLGRGRHIATAIVLINFFVILVLPLLALLWASFLPFFQPVRLKGFSLFTLENYRAVLNADYYLGLLWNTLFVAAVSATVAMGDHRHRRLVRGAPQVRRLGARPACHHAADLSRHRVGRGGDADLPPGAHPHLRHRMDPGDRLRDPLSALRHALFLCGHAADPSRAGRSRGGLRRLPIDHAAPHRRAAAGAGDAVRLAVHLSVGGAGAVAADPACQGRTRRWWRWRCSISGPTDSRPSLPPSDWSGPPS